MKKIASSVLVFLLALAAVFVLAACTQNADYFDSVYASSENLAANATSFDSEGKQQNKFALKGKASRRSNFVTVDLGEVKTFNTITLREKGEAVLRFSIYASNDRNKDYVHVYQGDTVETGRVCFTGDISYRYLRIFAVQVKANYNVNEIGVYYTKSASASALRNTAYLVINDVTEEYDLSTLGAFTDVILFSTATLSETGDISFRYGEDKVTKEEIVDDGERYAAKLDIVKRKLEELGRLDKVNLIADLYLPYGKVYEMMNNHLDNTIHNIVAFLNRFDLDGYDIDYEYPQNNKEWKAYNTFLTTLRAAIPGKILSIATSPYFLKFDKAAVEAIDRVQYMLYDCFESNGYQSAFPTVTDGVRKLLELGFRADQIELGVPTYSRPVDGAEFWGNYKDYAAQLGRYDNLLAANAFDHDGNPLTTPQYFNSYQMIADKTAFAIDAGLGGIMMFRVGCDLPYDEPLCLARAVVETIAKKQA